MTKYLHLPSLYMTLQPLPYEFPHIRRKFYFLFYQRSIELVTVTWKGSPFAIGTRR
jgi:hypothetical protein